MMTLSIQEMKEKIELFKSSHEQRISDAIGSHIFFEINWDSVLKSRNSERAVKTLFCWQGYFVIGRLVEAIEKFVYTSGCREIVASKMKTIRVESVSKGKNIFLRNSILTFQGNFSKGSAGVMKQNILEMSIAKVFEQVLPFYQKQVESKIIPETKKSISEIMDSELKIIIDWESFKLSSDISKTLSNFTSLQGHNSFNKLLTALRSSVRDDRISPKKLTKIIAKIVFIHSPKRKNVYINDDTLYVFCNWEDPWKGNLLSEDYQSIFTQSCQFYKLTRKMNKKRDQSSLLGKIASNLSDLSDCSFVQNGYIEHLRWITSQPIIIQPDKEDTEALKILLDKHVNRKKKKLMEVKIYGIPIQKVNKRGSYQDRLLLITNKSLYTMRFDYKKKKTVKSTIKQFDHIDYSNVYVGELRKKSTSNTQEDPQIQSNSKENFGILLQTIKRTSKKDPINEATKHLGLTTFQIYEKLVERQIVDQKATLEKFFPETSDYSISQLFGICCKSIAKQTNKIPVVTVGQFPPASILEILFLLEEGAERLETREKPKLPNVPEINLRWILDQVLFAVRDNKIEVSFPEKPCLRYLFKSILQAIRLVPDGNLKDIEPETPKPLGFKTIISSIASLLREIDDPLPNLEISNFELPDMLEILETIEEQIVDEISINFPKPKKIKLLDAIYSVCHLLSEIDLPLVKFSEIHPSIDFSALPFDLEQSDENVFIKTQSKSSNRSNFQQLIFRPLSDKGCSHELCLQVASIFRSVVVSANSPSYVPPVIECPIFYHSSVTGSLLTKMKGKSNKQK